MSLEGKSVVKDDTQTLDLEGGRNDGIINGEGAVVNFGKGGLCTNEGLEERESWASST